MDGMSKKFWTVDDVQYLAANYRTEDRAVLCKLLNRSWDSIQMKAFTLGLKRDKGSQRIVNGLKQCSRCKVWAGLSAFRGHSKTRTGLDSWCIGCKRLSWKLYKYNLTEDQYEDLIASGTCSICGGNAVDGNHSMPVDHDHKTGRVRGLLCTHCNKGLGAFRDNPSLLRAAADYLEQEKFLG